MSQFSFLKINRNYQQQMCYSAFQEGKTYKAIHFAPKNNIINPQIIILDGIDCFSLQCKLNQVDQTKNSFGYFETDLTNEGGFTKNEQYINEAPTLQKLKNLFIQHKRGQTMDSILDQEDQQCNEDTLDIMCGEKIEESFVINPSQYFYSQEIKSQQSYPCNKDGKDKENVAKQRIIAHSCSNKIIEYQQINLNSFEHQQLVNQYLIQINSPIKNKDKIGQTALNITPNHNQPKKKLKNIDENQFLNRIDRIRNFFKKRVSKTQASDTAEESNDFDVTPQKKHRTFRGVLRWKRQLQEESGKCTHRDQLIDPTKSTDDPIGHKRRYSSRDSFRDPLICKRQRYFSNL